MAYKTIHTALGLQLLAQAESQGTQIRLTHMAIGDGNGFPVDPVETQTQLVREQFRTTINRVFQDPENANKFTVEMIIPLSTGGFVMREVGVFDSNGNLILVGNLPDTYKPTEADGLFQGTVIRIPFMVSNASTIELMIDPNVVVATHSWIINTLTPAYLFPGGTIGQVLKKSSNIDGDTVWADPAETNVFVDSIEEEQLLTDLQTVVTLSTVTTTGLAVYINGQRIANKVGADGWTPASATSITLGQAYAAGSKILCVQNDPLGSAPYPLAQANNLSDVPDKDLARNNLDVFNKQQTRANGLPAGAISYFAMGSAPQGYLKANGALVSRTTYAELFAAIGTAYGAGDGVTTFKLPDLRGEFVRGWDDGRGIDSGRVLGSFQHQQVQRHKHLSMGEAYPDQWPFGMSNTGNMGSRGGIDYDNRFYFTNDGSDYNGASPNTFGVIGNETRPRNYAMLACIKY